MIRETTTRKGPKIKRLLFYRIIFLIVVGYILWLILDYKNCWIDLPFLDTQIHPALRNGPGLVPADLGRSFDTLGFEFGYARGRFLAHMLEIIDFKFRLWLFNYLPPHPSITFTGLLSLLLAPFLLFKMIYNLTSSRKAAWIGVSLYSVSTGFLPVLTVFSFPSRASTNLLTLYSFYLASRVTLVIKRDGYLSRRVLAVYIWMLVVLFFSFFTDESAWSLYICVPILFPALFAVKKGRKVTVTAYLLLLVVFLLVMSFLVPAAVARYGDWEFEPFWSYIPRTDGDPGINVCERFEFRKIIINGKNLIVNQLVPREEPLWGFVLLFLFSAYSVFLFTSLPPAKKKLVLRALFLLILFITFQSIAMWKGEAVEWEIYDPYYYGALFSFFLALPLAFLLSSARNRTLEVINRILFIYIVAVLAYNFVGINKNWDKFRLSVLKKSKTGERLTFPLIWKTWRDRDNAETISKMRKRFPLRMEWLFMEVKDRRYDQLITTSPNLPLSKSAVASGYSYGSDSENVDRLFDGDPATFWHTDRKLKQPTWVKIDFGEGEDKIIRSLAARPRRDHRDEFFHNAKLFGSVNGNKWELIAPIVQAKLPESSEWIRWNFDNLHSYRYYKLNIYDGYSHSRPPNKFASMAELALFE